MKILIEKDEWWPIYVFDLDRPYGREVEVSEEFIVRYVKALKEFTEVQDILQKLHDEKLHDESI